MNIIQAVILSIIEGVTEFLPISSTGHLILVSNLLRVSDTNFTKSFEIIIQLGAILAVFLIYLKTIFSHRDWWLKILIAFIPTGVIGYIVYKPLKTYLLGNPLIVIISLIIGGIILIFIDKYLTKNDVTIDKLSYKQAILIGLFQSVSIIPGVSRAAATIIGGMFMGLNRKDAVKFSFLLAIPTMTAATGLDLIKSSHQFSSNQFLILTIGFIITGITALLTVKLFLKIIQKQNFRNFGIYRIFIALIYWIFILK